MVRSRELQDIEQTVAEIWREFLPSADFDVEDDFFDLGGDSLGLISVVMRMGERFGISLDTDIVLDGATVAALSKGIYWRLAQTNRRRG
jgi:acyl carrier protein